MGKTSSAFAYGFAFFGVLCLFIGIAIITCGGMLSDVLSGVDVVEALPSTTLFHVSHVGLFEKYWLLTLYYLAPSFIAFIAACTRKFLFAGLYTLLNLISLIGSAVTTILLSILLAVWRAGWHSNLHVDCRDVFDNVNKFELCVCNETVANHTITFGHAHCEDLEGVNDIMTAMLVLVIIQMLVTFVASFVTFCSLYNPEEEPMMSNEENTNFVTKRSFKKYGGMFRGSNYDNL